MLYNPEWRGTLTLVGLIEWLERQPPDTAYFYPDPDNCLITHYMHDALGFKMPACSPAFGYGERDGFGSLTRAELPPHVDAVARHVPWTYGAALERARAYGG